MNAFPVPTYVWSSLGDVRVVPESGAHRLQAGMAVRITAWQLYLIPEGNTCRTGLFVSRGVFNYPAIYFIMFLFLTL